MAAVIEVEDLSSGYGGVPVVRGLNLNVQENEVVALLGPNGAGKTTTLLSIAGILAPLTGEVRVLGSRVPSGKANRVARRGVCLVSEDRSIFYSLTTRENLRLGMRGRRDGFEEGLKYFPALKPLLDRRAGLLSGGEQQMLALARALLTKPKVLMVDELSLGLAPIVVERLLPVMGEIAHETGSAVLLVEQHVHMALAVADRAYVMNRGRIVLEGAAAELRSSPELLQIEYLGSAAL